MMRSKAQVTLYVVMAILILIIVFLSFYIVSRGSGEGSGGLFTYQEKGFGTTGVENMIDSCIEKTGMEGLRLLGENGNHIRRPDLLKVDNTSYWIYRYSNVQPIFSSSKGDFEQWFDEEFKKCVDFSSFTGYEFSEGKVNSTIMYGAEDVVVDVHYPLNITRGEREKEMEDFSHTLNIRYRRILERAKDIVEAHYQQNFDYRDALEFVDERDFNITYEIMDEDNLKFTIMDLIEYQGNNYTFKFATNLNKSHVKRRVNVSEKSLNFYEPFKVYSPNRRAVLTLEPGIKVSDGPIKIWPDYAPVGTRYNVTNDVTYTLSGGSISPGPQKQENFTWSLHYPIYHFTPNGTAFYKEDPTRMIPQNLKIYWDEEKNPNRGRMGLLYKGSFSDGKWIPYESRANYEENYVETNIQAFSSYTVVDCARQECKSAEVTSESEPSGFCLGWLLDWILKIILVVIIIILIIITVGAAGAAASAAATAAASAAGAASAVGSAISTFVTSFISAMGAAIGGGGAALGGFGLGSSLGGGFTVAGMQVSAFAVGMGAIIGGMMVGSMGPMSANVGYESGNNYVNAIPTCDQKVELTCTASGKFADGYGQLNDMRIDGEGTKTITVAGGKPQRLTAVAKECEKSALSCNSCSITCSVTYK